MNKFLKLAVVLTAVDNMTATIQNATQKSARALDTLNKGFQADFMINAGKKGIDALQAVIDKYSELEYVSAKLKTNLMDTKGFLDPKLEKQFQDEANKLGNLLPGETTDMVNMFNTMYQSGVKATEILNGAGRAAALLAIATDNSYEMVASSTGKMMNALGISGKELYAFYDQLQRTKNLNVPLEELQNAFARSAGALKFVGLQGLESGKVMTAFYSMFIRDGLKGQTVGTNFSRILMEILNPAKYDKMNAAAKQYGITLDLLDKQGNFIKGNNIVVQFDKLSKLNTRQITDILKPLTGAEGLDDSMIKSLTQNGLSKYNYVIAEMQKQADLEMKIKILLDTIKNQQERSRGTFGNLLAKMGETIRPEVMKFLEIVNKVLERMIKFVEFHPKFTKAILLLIGALSLLAIGKGFLGLAMMVIRITGILRPLIPLMLSFSSILTFNVKPAILGFIKWLGRMGMALLTTPTGWLILGLLALGAALVYCYFKFDKFAAIVNGSAAVVWHYLKIVWLLHKALFNLVTLDFTGLKNNWAEFKALSNQNLAEIYQNAYDNTLKVRALQKGIGGDTSINVMGKPNSIAVPVGKQASNNNSQYVFNPTINITTDAKGDGKAIGQDFQKHLERLFKEWEHNQQRLSFR